MNPAGTVTTGKPCAPRKFQSPCVPLRPFTVGPGPDPGPLVQPFVRFGNTVFAPEDLSLARFEDYGEVAEALGAVGVSGVDDLACSEPSALAGALGASEEEVATLVASAQQALRRLAGSP